MNSRECPKCTNSYFTLEISWLEKSVNTVYTCESCNWKFTVSNCTLPAKSPGLSCSSQLAVSEQQSQSEQKG